MARVIFGSPEAATILKKDRPLRAAAAREAAIEKARREGKKGNFTVYIEPRAIERSVVVEAYSGEEAWDIAEEKHLNYDEIITGVEEA